MHVRCDPLLDMRRPMSLMRADPAAGRADVLYKEVGRGTRLLAEKRPGDRLSVIGPVGRPFEAVPGRPRALLLGGGVGIPPVVFLADRLRHDRSTSLFVAFGSEAPFPFEIRRSNLTVPGLDGGADATMSLLEDWGGSRPASRAGPDSPAATAATSPISRGSGSTRSTGTRAARWPSMDADRSRC